MIKTKKAINRIRVVLAEKDRTNRWLAEKLGKTDATISKWCANKMQPSLETLVQIAIALAIATGKSYLCQYMV
ncbi:MAG TPA: helix-turn-helix transcriptional regulator, partial [Bacteroidia bacterium]|nr:helix-turn-helix transcriptional regulator [Bacteroidia bacterium]